MKVIDVVQLQEYIYHNALDIESLDEFIEENSFEADVCDDYEFNGIPHF